MWNKKIRHKRINRQNIKIAIIPLNLGFIFISEKYSKFNNKKYLQKRLRIFFKKTMMKKENRQDKCLRFITVSIIKFRKNYCITHANDAKINKSSYVNKNLLNNVTNSALIYASYRVSIVLTTLFQKCLQTKYYS